MDDQVDHIKEILNKYSISEQQLERKLDIMKQNQSDLDESNTNSSTSEPCKLNLEEAKLRNTNLIKSLEISKARLRSRSTFSPVEQILHQAIDNYRKKPALLPYSESPRQGSLQVE